MSADWVIRVLKDSAPKDVMLSDEFEQWLWDNVDRKTIRVCVEDCVCHDLDFLSKYKDEEKFCYQDGKEIKEVWKVDKSKQALIFLGDTPDEEDPYNVIFWYIPKNTSKK